MHDRQREEKPLPSPLEYARHYFISHRLSEEQQNRAEALRAGAQLYVEEIIKNTKPCPDQTAAIRKLREAHMTLVQCIAMEEVGR